MQIQVLPGRDDIIICLQEETPGWTVNKGKVYNNIANREIFRCEIPVDFGELFYNNFIISTFLEIPTCVQKLLVKFIHVVCMLDSNFCE